MTAPEGFPKRTHTCGELRIAHAGQQVTLNGWIEARRDLGTLVFIDLRDRYGVTQVAFDPGTDPGLKAAAKELKPEYVLAVTGRVRPRPEEARNPAKATGEIEVYAESIRILNPARTPPFEISDTVKVSDELRMRHRYLDLRRRRMARNLLLRHRVVLAMRNALAEQGFVEVETPMLTRSTPEGARDFLVPSRLHKGAFYALPQSPQLFKQLLMVGGLDRYFQVVRCIRDEDLRADRQPEFTQLDLELSFAEEEEVYRTVEVVMASVFEAAGRTPPARPFPRIPYDEAVTRYGTDKPDTRFGMELFDLTDLAAQSGFDIFRKAVEGGGVVLGITAPGCAGWSRKELDGLTAFAKERGGKGIAWFKVQEGGVASPLAKFFSAGLQAALVARAGAGPGDLVLAAADAARRARLVLGELRVELAGRLGMVGEETALCWVVDFPMFEEEEDTGRLVPSHHPFTTPREEYEGHLEKDPSTLKARAYDLVMNGVELGSGSVRIHRRELQARVFHALGIAEEEARRKFGFLLEAFEYGAPPHAGIALGVDRLVMLLAGEENIREVIAFPKSATGACPLTGAPAPVEESLLRDLGIALRKAGKNKEG